MINYMRSEIYKVVKSKAIYISIAIVAILMIGLSLMIKFFNAKTGSSYDASILVEAITVNAFNVPLYLAILIVSFVFADEYKNRTMTNSISYGFNRAQIFFGKFFVEVLTAIVFAIVSFAFLIFSSWLILGFGSSDMSQTMSDLILSIFNAFPIWLAGIAVANMLAFLLTSSMAFSTVFMVIIVIVPFVFDTVALFTDKLDFIKNYLLSCQLSMTNYVTTKGVLTNADISFHYLLGLAYIAASLFIGYYGFRKKEIK